MLASLPEHCLRRPVATLTCVVAAMVLGLISLARLPLEYLPEIQGNSLTVSCATQGGSAAEVERSVVHPLEDALATLPGLESLSSTARASGAEVRVELAAGSDVDAAALEVRERLDRARADLPPDLGRIEVRRWRSSDMPVIRCRAAAPAGAGADALERFVDDVLLPRLSRVEGVGNVEVRGLARRRVLVELDGERLAAAGLSAGDVATLLQRRNRNAAAGLLRSGGRVLSIRVLGELGDAEQVAALPLGEGRTLGDVGRVREEAPPLDRIERLDGRPAVTLRIAKESGANTLETCRRVREELEALRASSRGQACEVQVFSDHSERISVRLTNLLQSGLYGGALLCAVLWLFLRERTSTVIVAATIPLSVVLTFGIMYLLRRLDVPLSLNVVSMMGLILGIGLVVDSGIVVLENAVRLGEEGLPPREAASRGAAEVAHAVAASVLTSLIVFVPLLFTDSVGSRWTRDLGQVVCASVFSSLWVALSVVPLLAARWLPRRPGGGGGPGRLARGYRRALEATLAWRWAVLLVLPLCGWQVWTFFRDAERGWGGGESSREVSVQVEVPRAFTSEERLALFDRLEAAVLARREELDLSRLTSSFQRSAEATPSRGRHGGGGGGDNLELLLRGQGEPGERVPLDEARRRLRQLLPQVPGVAYRLDASRRMGGGGKQVRVLVTGRNADELLEPARRVAAVLARVPGVEEVLPGEGLDAAGVEVRPRRARAARFGLGAAQVGRAVAAALGERSVTRLRGGQRELEVVLRVDDLDRAGLDDLARTVVPGGTGGVPLPVGSLADLVTAPAPREVVREDREAVTTVTAVVVEGEEVRTVTGRIERALQGEVLPPGTGWRLGWEVRRWQEDEGQSAGSVLLAFTLVLMLLCALFESWVLPLVIAVTVPFALVGVAWAFRLTGTRLDEMAWIGLMILVGISVNHGIVLVDRALQLLAQGVDRREAVLRAGQDRLRPIVMTASTTVLGLLPVVLQQLLPESFQSDSGAGVYGPIGLAVASGLVISTGLSLLVLPALLDLVLGWRERLGPPGREVPA